MSTCCFLQVCPRRLRGRLRELLFRVLLSGSVMSWSHRILVNLSTHQLINPLTSTSNMYFTLTEWICKTFRWFFPLFRAFFCPVSRFAPSNSAPPWHPRMAHHHGIQPWHPSNAFPPWHRTQMAPQHSTQWHHAIRQSRNQAPPTIGSRNPCSSSYQEKKAWKAWSRKTLAPQSSPAFLPSFLPSFLPCLIACLLAGWLACCLAGCLVSLLACLISWNTKLEKKDTKNRVSLTPPCLICCRFISCCNQHGNLD